MKTVLINPPRINQVWAGVPDIFNSRDVYLFPPLGIMYLSSAIKTRSKHQVKMIDAQAENLNSINAADRALKENPDFIGITAQTHNLFDVYAIVGRIREKSPKTHIMLGGPHCWSFPDEALEYSGADSILRGDGEESLPLWLDALENGSGKETVPGVIWKDSSGEKHENPPILHQKDIDSLPFPDREGLDGRLYYTPGMKASATTTMITSRGCPNNCTFCNTYQRYSVRSPSNIADEMEQCRDRHGIREIHFIDDLFNGTAQRVMEISEEIIKRKIGISWGFKASCRQSTPEMVALAKEAGCTKIHYGVETGSDEGLKSINKNTTTELIREVFEFTKKAGIRTVAYMMLGLPGEKDQSCIDRSVRFVKELDPDFVVWALMSPYPDTEIFRRGVKLGLFPEDCWNNYMKNPQQSHQLPTVWEEHFTKQQLINLFKKVHREFYFNPRKILKTLTSISTGDELKRILRGGLTLLKMELLTGDGKGRL